MSWINPTGWRELIASYPWFDGDGHYPLPAYSEFMPPPRLGRSPFDSAIDPMVFSEDDPFGWRVPEIEEEIELRPGLEDIGKQIMEHLLKLGRGKPGHHIGGHQNRNLKDNLYWPSELAERAGRLDHERYIVLLPLALAKTQDDLGRVRWTFFGSSEQGPERAFWKSFYSAPDQEVPEQQFFSFMQRLLFKAYGKKADNPGQLRDIGFRILPSEQNPRFPYWMPQALPSWTRPYVISVYDAFDDIRYLLTFNPFDQLPTAVKEKYMEGKLALLPFPGSLVFWGIPIYLRLQEQLPTAFQIPLLRLVGRHDAPGGIRVPQSGWLREPRRDQKTSRIQEKLLLNAYRRTSRWNRVRRYEDAAAKSTHVDKVTQTLFSTALDALDLYNKPMARNVQVWTEQVDLLLDGPNATRQAIQQAADAVVEGGLFRYRFQFPPMRVGCHEIYWHRPMVSYLGHESGQIEILPDAPLGYMTAYRADLPDLTRPVELWPRLLRRETYLSALRDFESVHDLYPQQTALNILTLLDTWRLLGKRALPRGFARQLLRIARHESLDDWFQSLSEHASNSSSVRPMQRDLQQILEPADRAQPLFTSLTFGETATRSFEVALWKDMLHLSRGSYINKDNADIVQDSATRKAMAHHCRDLGHPGHRGLDRDLAPLGNYLISRHRKAIKAADMEGAAIVGELPFRWQTDFDFSLFGGWKANQNGQGCERNILVVIPGKNRSEAIVMADHYDTAYMEDVYEKARGGSGARLAAAGADDNHSATATLLQATPIFLELAKAGRLERDIWLLHLTGEEFPSDCLGARHFCQALVEKTLKMKLSDDHSVDLFSVRVVGVFVLDMIAHNRDDKPDIFQISPGRGAQSLHMAHQAHIANAIWNSQSIEWNKKTGRRAGVRGKRSADGVTIPEIALHPQLNGEVRTIDNPKSSLYNTDGQIFSDIGAPVVLFMENYDIDRSGYHDTKDTMENIDLDYGAALSAIAIETTARVAALANDQIPRPCRLA